MKRLKAGTLTLILFCATAQLYGQQITLKLTNQLNAHRNAELIALDRSFLERKLGKLGEHIPIEITGSKDQLVPGIQFDDLNGDGKWDKAVFLYSFLPKQSVQIKLQVSGDFQITRGPYAHVRHQRKLKNNSFGHALPVDTVPAGQQATDFTKVKLPPFLTEGPAWENDKVGFRIYMDVRNTKDIWGKTTSDMVLDSVGSDTSKSYHHLASWGMDILAVGKSLGAGSLALKVPVPGKADTLVRLGGINMGKILYRKIADGPARAIFELEYPEWNVLGDGRLTSLTERISIWGGQYFYESRISLKNAPPGATLVSGIVNLKSKASEEIHQGNISSLYTYDKQSEHNDRLGMAIMVPESSKAVFDKTPDKNSEVMNTYTVSLKPTQQPALFRFYACWERTDSKFSSEARFKKFLISEMKAQESSILIK